MSQIYTPSSTEHGSYVLPSDGDPAVAESVNQALRDLADSALNANSVADAAAALAAQMVNGVTGGAYTPTADIQIKSDNGGGLNVDGTFVHEGGTATFRPDSVVSVLGSFSVSGAAVIQGPTLTVGAETSTSFNADVAVETLTANTLTSNGTTVLGESASDALSVEATSTFEAPATFNDGARVNGTLVCSRFQANQDVQLGNSSSDAVSLVGTVTLQQPLEYSGVGRVGFRPPVMLPNSSATVGIEDGDLFIIRDDVSSGRVYTISADGAVAGDRIAIQAGGNGVNNTVAVSTLPSPDSFVFSSGNRGGALLVYITDRPDGFADGWYLISYYSH